MNEENEFLLKDERYFHIGKTFNIACTLWRSELVVNSLFLDGKGSFPDDESLDLQSPRENAQAEIMSGFEWMLAKGKKVKNQVKVVSKSVEIVIGEKEKGTKTQS